MKCNWQKNDDRVRYECLEGAVAATDLCYLTVLHDKYGFGEKRLKEVLQAVQEVYIDYRDSYCAEEDYGNITVKSPHIVALEEDLKSASGVNYSDEIRRSEQEHKGRWRGNKRLGK